MTFLYRRGKGARRRVMHICGHDFWTGKATFIPLCGDKHEFDTTCNWPLGHRICKRCHFVLIFKDYK